MDGYEGREIRGIDMDHIVITDLEVYANHGVLNEEQKLGQKFLVSVDMSLDFSSAAAGDDLNKTINYAAVAEVISAYMKENTFKLIETVADRLATKLMTMFTRIAKITVTVKKPWAPIGMPLDMVSVSANRSWHRAVIALGSNLGDRESYLQLGIDTLKRDGICIDRVSSNYETKPMGYTDQDDFLNACVSIRTLLTPQELLGVCHEAEIKAGRERIIHWGPRTLDLDIICYDSLVLNTEELTIPHPQMHLRRFVLEPMEEIAPGWKHPIIGETVSRMLELLPSDDMRKSEFDLKNLEFVDSLNKKDPTVMYFGVPGSYSQAAMFSYFGRNVDCRNTVNWDEACDAVINGDVDYAVFPIENSNAGAVSQMFDALVNREVYIAAETFLPVRHCLVGLPDAEMEDIDTVYSHPQALMQCEKYLGAKEWKCISMENTAVAARFVLDQNKKNQAAIAGEIVADLYGLKILDSGINDNKNNITRFCILANHPIVCKGAKKISICIELSHESGSLYKLLSYISVFGLNMTKIESRPIPGRNFEYRFFIDFDGDLTMPDVASAMRGIRQNANRFWFLGNF